ncbi:MULTISPECIES: 2'-5' RNA ligase family protein [unclassified Ekhidna]|jgi:2'-5' RNA ligase|uniref:2'-5' RNA ligase family protein n=1 Tax=unclassified Ekhidna TaxID=2632188 RepID=UPI0032DF2956
MSESLYFIAVLPPEEIHNEITHLKHEVAEKFDSKHALRSPPHITLHMPFKWKDKRYEELTDVIKNLNSDLKPFGVRLKNFDFFEPRVVFVNVVENGKLEELQKKVVDACRKQLKLDNANYKNRSFHPHVTIGFRDLKKRMFYEAKKEFEERKVSFKFLVNEITLLKHDGKKWNVVDL